MNSLFITKEERVDERQNELDISKRQFYGVIGKVGSGKTKILKGLAR